MLQVNMKEFMKRLAAVVSCGTPVRFYPYTSCVINTGDTCQLDYHDSEDVFQSSMTMLCKLFQAAGIKYKHKSWLDKEMDGVVAPDNKIVFEFTIHKGGKYEYPMFVGFYDGIMSIGKKIATEHLQPGDEKRNNVEGR